MSRILLVEDDPTLRMGLSDALSHEGYELLIAADGARAEELLYARHFDLIVLDLMLPMRGGLEILREMRSRGLMTPVLLLTARSSESDKVLGLELGADDYVTKPFGLRELLARVRVLLRRGESGLRNSGDAMPPAFNIGDCEIDLAAFLLRRAGQEEPLTPKEVAMLDLLRRSAPGVVSRQRFLAAVWGGGDSVTNRTIDTHVLNLRRKIEVDPKKPRRLLTVHGAGYRLILDDEIH